MISPAEVLAPSPVHPPPATRSASHFHLNMFTHIHANRAIDATLGAHGTHGVAFFGRTDCAVCKETYAAIEALGIVPTVVPLDKCEGGAAIEKELEHRTGQGKEKMPHVFLDGKFVGGKDEVAQAIADGEFDQAKRRVAVVYVDELGKEVGKRLAGFGGEEEDKIPTYF